MLYTKEKLQEIKNKIGDYYEWYKEFLPNLQVRGINAWTPCPFHNEAKPSFQLNVETGYYRCWGCGERGDIFTFYMKYHGYNFNDTVQILAEKYGVTLELDPEEQNRIERRKKLFEINNTICNGFQKSLQGDNDAWNYLTQIRGLSPKIIKDFRIGRGIDKLPDKQSLKDLGLLVSKDNGNSYYSKFGTDRVVMPFIDEFGNITSFVGRFHVDKDGAKYMYTSNTEIHNKSEHLFGIYQAKRYIKALGSVILVEGQFDTIKSHQKGICNTVTIGGLNLSEYQINLLKKYTNTFYFVIEDGAMICKNKGENTLIENSHLAKNYELIRNNIPYAKVYVIDLRNTDGSKCDPDEYFNTHSASDFRNLIKHAKIYNEFIISEKLKELNFKNIEEKSKALAFIVPVLHSIQNFLDRKQYIELVANKMMLPENDIYRAIKKYTEKTIMEANNNITWETKPVYAQKIMLSSIFYNKFDTIRAGTYIAMKALNLLEGYYRYIFKDIIAPFILKEDFKNGKLTFKDFLNDVQYDDNINEEVKNTILDIYFKSEQLDDFESEDLDTLLEEQIETLKEWSIPDETQDIEQIVV